jgi:hypothetical protein
MTEPQTAYVTESVTDEDERKHFHDCGHLIGVECDGVLVRKGDIYYSLLLVCPDCRTLITWRADRLKAMLARQRREYHGLLAELDIDKIVISASET